LNGDVLDFYQASDTAGMSQSSQENTDAVITAENSLSTMANSGKRKHPLKRIVILALISLLLYPLLETIGTFIDATTGRDTTTNGAGWVPFHSFSEPAMYLFIYGLTAAVALSFIHLLVQTWRTSRSKIGIALISLIGTIVTFCASGVFVIGLMIIGGLIHQSF
jgi:hypothetical protein